MANIAPSRFSPTNRYVLAPNTTVARFVVRTFVFVCFLGSLSSQCQQPNNLSADPQKRISQLSDVVSKLPASTDEVLGALSDSDPTVTQEALKQLSSQEHLPQSVRVAVTQLISSPDSGTQVLAIGCLAHSRITNSLEIDAITKALADPVAAVRLAAVQATPMVDGTAKCTVDNLAPLLEDSDSSVQAGALKALPEIKCDQTTTVPILARLSGNSSSPTVRAAALSALGNSTANISKTKSLLLGLVLKDSDADVRREAVLALQNVEALSPEEVASLAPIIHDSTSLVRQSATYTLVILGRNQPNGLDSLDPPDTDDQNAKRAAVLALEMVSGLQRDKDEGVRDAVATALRYGTAETPFLSLIAKSLNDGSLEVRDDAVASLLKLKGEKDNAAEEDGGPTNHIYSPPDGEGIWPQELTDASLRALGQSQPASIREDIANAIRRYGAYDARLVKRLTELATTDPDYWSRRACVRAISNVETTPATLTALIAATRDSQPVVRKQALIGLGKVSSVGSTKPNHGGASDSHKTLDPSLSDIERSVALRLDDKEVGVRLAAFHALESGWSSGFLEDSKWPRLSTTKAQIVKDLQDEDPDIRKAAAKALQSPPIDGSEIQALLQSLQDENVEVGIEAAKSLASLTFPIVDVKKSLGLLPNPLMDLTPMRVVVAAATRGLETIEPKCHVIDALISAVGVSKSSQLHFEEMQSLATITVSVNSIVTSLQEGEAPANNAFIQAAGDAVDGCAPSVERAEAFVKQRIGDPNPQIRGLLVDTSGKLQLQSADVIAVIYNQLKDDNREVRHAAVVAIPNIIPKENTDEKKVAATKLITSTADSDSDVRSAAVRAIIELKSSSALIDAFRSPDPEVRKAILEGCAELNTPTSAIDATLREGLKDPDRRVRLQALSYLATKGRDGLAFAKGVLPLLSDTSAEIRARAATLLGYYRANATFAVNDLQKLLHDDDVNVISAAVDTLGWIGPAAAESVPALISLLTTKDVSPHAKRALHQIGDAAIPQLTLAAQNSANKEQAQRAAEVLTEIKANQKEQLIVVKLKNGNEHTFDLHSGAVFAVATWCPFSQRLRDFLSRDDVKPYFGGTTLYFLLEDETATVRVHLQRELKSHKDWTAEQNRDAQLQIEEIEAKVASVGYYDESFLKTLPGERFQVTTLSSLALEGFPSILASNAPTSANNLTKDSWISVHDWVSTDWFSERVNMPEAMRSELRRISGGSIFGF